MIVRKKKKTYIYTHLWIFFSSISATGDFFTLYCWSMSTLARFATYRRSKAKHHIHAWKEGRKFNKKSNNHIPGQFRHLKPTMISFESIPAPSTSQYVFFAFLFPLNISSCTFDTKYKHFKPSVIRTNRSLQTQHTEKVQIY